MTLLTTVNLVLADLVRSQLQSFVPTVRNLAFRGHVIRCYRKTYHREARVGQVAVVWAEDAGDDQFLIRSALEPMPDAPRNRFAIDGAEAVAEVRRRKPRLIVLDINMPNVDGIEALRRLRAQHDLDNVPIVMFSTAKNPNEVLVCNALGVTAFVQKPVKFEQFSDAVRGIIALAG